MDTLGDRGTEGVSGNKFLWDNAYIGKGHGNGRYTFSIRNRLRQPVTNVYCLVIFYDAQGDPIDVDAVWTREILPFQQRNNTSGAGETDRK